MSERATWLAHDQADLAKIITGVCGLPAADAAHLARSAVKTGAEFVTYTRLAGSTAARRRRWKVDVEHGTTFISKEPFTHYRLIQED